MSAQNRAAHLDVQPLTMTQPNGFQGLTLWLGDRVVTITDDCQPDVIRTDIRPPLQRATTIARLRAIADILDVPDTVQIKRLPEFPA